MLLLLYLSLLVILPVKNFNRYYIIIRIILSRRKSKSCYWFSFSFFIHLYIKNFLYWMDIPYSLINNRETLLRVTFS
ncbi:MAG: hypothetical protein C4292_03640 [Nitrososphaera sp.]